MAYADGSHPPLQVEFFAFRDIAASDSTEVRVNAVNKHHRFEIMTSDILKQTPTIGPILQGGNQGLPITKACLTWGATIEGNSRASGR